MPYETLREEESDGAVVLTLNRPERRNALSPRMIAELCDAMQRFSQRRSGVLILTGAGAAFSAGMDLEHLQSLAGRTQAEHREDSERIRELFWTLYACPLPTIAAVNGHAIAGGTGLATICDFTLAVPEAKFGYTEAKIGFVPAVVSAFLVRQVGEKQARDLLLTARLFSAEEARALGLINEVVAAPVLERAHALAQALLRNSPESLRATKRLLLEDSRSVLTQQLDAAVEANLAARATPDFFEGVSSFLEKRTPVWNTEPRERS